MSRRRSPIRLGVARGAVALAIVALVASSSLSWVAISGVADGAFWTWVFDHLTLVISLTAGSAVVAIGLALTALNATDTSATSRAQAKFALTCVSVAVVISLGAFGITRGQGR